MAEYPVLISSKDMRSTEIIPHSHQWPLTNLGLDYVQLMRSDVSLDDLAQIYLFPFYLMKVYPIWIDASLLEHS